MITTSDGLQYEDALHVLLDKPLNNARNRWVTYHREEGRSEDFIRTWIKGWDATEGPRDCITDEVSYRGACQATGWPKLDYRAEATSASSAKA